MASSDPPVIGSLALTPEAASEQEESCGDDLEEDVMDNTATEDIKKLVNSEVEFVKPAVKEEAEQERGQGDIVGKEQEKKLSQEDEKVEVRGGAELVVEGGDSEEREEGKSGSHGCTGSWRCLIQGFERGF